MDIPVYLAAQRATLTADFDALKQANEQARSQIASIESSIKTRNEALCQLQGAFAQLRHLESASASKPEPHVVGTDAPLLAAVPRKRRLKPNGAMTQEQAHG